MVDVKLSDLFGIDDLMRKIKDGEHIPDKKEIEEMKQARLDMLLLHLNANPTNQAIVLSTSTGSDCAEYGLTQRQAMVLSFLVVLALLIFASQQHTSK